MVQLRWEPASCVVARHGSLTEAVPVDAILLVPIGYVYMPISYLVWSQCWDTKRAENATPYRIT